MNQRVRNVPVGLLLLLLLAALPLAAQEQPSRGPFPPGFIPPPLNPKGVVLEAKQLAPGVYALLSSRMPVDNSGFVVGERGVLVIDSHINGEMARQIQAAVRQVTAKPILYLVNTNFFGDHWFGNYAFPGETLIIAHRRTAEGMREFDRIKQGMLATVDNDPTVFADLRPRFPDLVFDNYLQLDLGGRVVELYHFGPGNTPGDTVVYVPEAKAAWTGNLITASIPIMFHGGAGAYMDTIARFARTLEVETVVPGHGGLLTGAVFGRYLAYLSDLIGTVRRAASEGKTLEQTVGGTPLAEAYAPAKDSPLYAFVIGVHRLNLFRAYQGLSAR